MGKKSYNGFQYFIRDYLLQDLTGRRSMRKPCIASAAEWKVPGAAQRCAVGLDNQLFRQQASAGTFNIRSVVPGNPETF
ncbi:hypothetical protein AO356_26455 [Pseudomonas fluorescens]|uniref:Uncharacterized protein n=1 Tax=Pseudomonas fluorescens TaxID=294 RepID=A0A0N9WEQ4_PSEFL|nr:hypothetical protein AO356_26455 [Pseudomonas fluorescens]